MIQTMKNTLANYLKVKFARIKSYNIMPQGWNNCCCSGHFLFLVNVASAAESVDEKHSSLLLNVENCRKKFFDIMPQRWNHYCCSGIFFHIQMWLQLQNGLMKNALAYYLNLKIAVKSFLTSCSKDKTIVVGLGIFFNNVKCLLKCW